MTRRPRSSTPLLLAGLAALPIACDYGGSTETNTRATRGPMPSLIRPGSSGGGSSPVVTPSSGGDSREGRERREAILNNVIRLIQSAAVTPGGKHFEIAVKNLNEYFEEGTRSTDFYLSQDSRKYLETMFGSKEAVREFESPSFALIDARHIEDCMMYSEIANRLAGERLPGESGDLPRVRRLFEWIVRQVQLVPPPSLAPPGSREQAQARPYDVLLRGMATEAGGGWSERGWLFMSLCRQLGIDVGLVSYTPRHAPAGLSIAPAPEGEAAPIVWVCAALVDGKAYLFDQRLGLPIPDAKGDGVATLDEAMTDATILDRLDLPGQFPYGTTRAALLTSAGKITILIDSSRGYFAPKMRLLQQRLTGKDRTILFRDPVEQARHFAKVLGPRLGDVRPWNLPYSTETLLFTSPAFTQATLYPLRPFDGSLPLLYARVAQLKGDIPSAIEQYVKLRFAVGATRRDKKTPITRAEQHDLDVYATHFLALCHLERGGADQAEFFFKQLLKQTPPPTPAEFCHMFRWGAETNLGLLARSRGDVPAATRYLSAMSPTAQTHGNFVLARDLVWRNPTSPVAPALPPAPASANPVAEAASK